MSNLNWNQVKADFHDTNQSMATSVGALSQAGTVFGQLRKSILDEEQRQVDNAYREQKFNEDVRQFGLEHALRKDKFNEDVRQFGLNYALKQDELRENATHHRNMESIQSQQFRYQVAKDRQEQQARKDFYNLLDKTDKEYKQASAAYVKDRNDYFKKNSITDENLMNIYNHEAEMEAKLAENKKNLDLINQGGSVTLLGADPESPDFDPENPESPLQETIQFGGPDSPEAKTLKEERAILEQQRNAASEARVRMESLRDQYDSEHKAPINGLPQDPLTRAMMMERYTGLSAAKELPGLVAIHAMENAQKQAQAEANRETTLQAAAIRAGGSHNGNTDSSIKWWTSHGVKDPVNAGNADMITNAISQIVKSKGKNISKDTIRSEVLSSLFSRSAISHIPGKDNDLTPAGWTGSTSDLENILNYILGNDKNPSSSTKATVARLLNKLGLN